MTARRVLGSKHAAAHPGKAVACKPLSQPCMKLVPAQHRGLVAHETPRLHHAVLQERTRSQLHWSRRTLRTTPSDSRNRRVISAMARLARLPLFSACTMRRRSSRTAHTSSRRSSSALHARSRCLPRLQGSHHGQCASCRLRTPR